MGLIPNNVQEIFNNWVFYAAIWVMNGAYVYVTFTHGDKASVFFSSVIVANFLFAFRSGSIAIKYGYTSRSFYDNLMRSDYDSYQIWQSGAMLGTGWGPLEDEIVHAAVRSCSREWKCSRCTE